MCESLGSTKPTGKMKVKGGAGRAEVGSPGSVGGAPPARLMTGVVSGGGARAYTLGPERW